MSVSHSEKGKYRNARVGQQERFPLEKCTVPDLKQICVCVGVSPLNQRRPTDFMLDLSISHQTIQSILHASLELHSSP